MSCPPFIRGTGRRETQEKIQHFLQSGTKPITCKAIAEKGFVCPKLENGSCSCKSPAALCYLPLSLDELREAPRLGGGAEIPGGKYAGGQGICPGVFV